jgi:hypothetical protein
MPAPRVRFTIRTMMIGVIFVAIILFVVVEFGQLRRVARLRRQEAAKYAEMEAIFRRELARTEQDAAWSRAELASPADEYKNMKQIAGERLYYLEQEISRYGRIIQHAATLKRKYEIAASRPWQSVGPDPPMPR